jgi:gliding motility-associated-like protein
MKPEGMTDLKQWIVILFLTILYNQVKSQQIHWAHQVSSNQSDNLESHAVDSDENIIAVGYFEETITVGDFQLSSKDQSDVFIYKTNKNGQVLWAHTLGGPVYGGDVGVTVDEIGNIYIAGGFIDKLYFDNNLKLTSPVNSASWSSFVTKLDLNGNMLWVKGIYPQASAEVRVWGNIAVNDQGNIAVAGMFGGSIDVSGVSINKAVGDPGSSIFLALFNSSGEVVWVKNPPSDTYATVNDIEIDNQSNIYFTGFFTNTISFGSTSLTAANTTHSDIYLAKYNESGNAPWAKGIIKTEPAALNNEGRGLAVDAAGNIYLAGTFKGTVSSGSFSISGINTSEDPGNADGFIASYDENGSLNWLKRIGTSNPDIVNDIALTNRNSFIVTGGRDGFRIFFQEYNLLGILILDKEFNGNGIAESISFVSNGDVYISGLLFGSLVEDNINFSALGTDGFLLKYAAGVPVEVTDGFIPNVITPNGDTFNDTFKIPIYMQGSPIVIYNRWGQLVYSDVNYQNTWNGDKHSSGVYFFKLETDCCNTIKGFIHVVR